MRATRHHEVGEKYLHCTEGAEIGDIVSVCDREYTFIGVVDGKILIDRPLETEVPEGAPINVCGSWKYSDYFWSPNLEMR